MNAARLLLLGCLAATLVSARTEAQTYAESFTLRPGWNAIWLSVQPTNREPASVFAGLPLHSVWTWSDRVTATEFIQNPGDAGWNRAQWLSYFPPESPERVLSNLRAVLSHRAYLVRLAGTHSVVWSVSGIPVVRRATWATDRYNLRGFPVDPEVAVSFRTFFRPSPAHYDPKTDQLEPIFRLAADGRWSEVAPHERIVPGEAYWVHTRGASDYVAPFHLELNSGETMDFDATDRTVALVLHNRHALTKSIRIEHTSSNLNHLLHLPASLPGAPGVPEALGVHTQAVAAGTSQKITLAIDRTRLPTQTVGKTHNSLVSVSDQEGTKFVILTRALSEVAPSYTGLWLGTASVDQVAPTSDSGSTSGAADVSLPFPLRVLLHVDATGQATLLREVTMIFTATNAAAATTNAPAPLRFGTRATRLLTDPAIVSQLSTLDLRSGRITGRRLTAPHFDFVRPDGQFGLPLTGTFAPSNQVSGTLHLSPDLPSNPFLHRYHPDHGTNRSYEITRNVQFAIGAMDAAVGPDGSPSLTGTYSEVIEGLHKSVLSTSGTLSLRRISDVGTLNAP